MARYLSSLEGLWAVMRRELRLVVSRPLYLCCMVVAPVLVTLMLTSLMGDGLPQGLPAGVVDLDNSNLSRSVVRNLGSMQQTDIVAQYGSVAEAREAVQRGEVYAFFFIPEGFSADVQAQRQPRLSFYTNYTYMIAGSLLFRDMKMMSELTSGSAQRSVLYARGATERQAMAQLQPIVVDAFPIGNPWLNYSVYLSNILIPGILGLLVMMVTVCSIGVEIKYATAREWLTLTRGQMLQALLGKLLLHTLIWALVGTAILSYLYGWLGYPLEGGLAPMWCAMLLMILASQGLGVVMIALLPTLRLGLSFASLWGMVSFSICGASFPVMAMPPAIQALSYLFPLRHYYLIYATSALDGFSLYYAWGNVLSLLAMALLPIVLLPRLRAVVLVQRYIP